GRWDDDNLDIHSGYSAAYRPGGYQLGDKFNFRNDTSIVAIHKYEVIAIGLGPGFDRRRNWWRFDRRKFHRTVLVRDVDGDDITDCEHRDGEDDPLRPRNSVVVYHVRCGNGGQHFDDVVYFPKRDRRTLGSLDDVVSARVSGDFRRADRGQRYRVLYMGKEK